MKTVYFILLLLLISAVSYATVGDTTKVKYDLNDPRNPDCPCHKYQKLADEEYQRQIAKEAIQQSSKETAETIIDAREDALAVVSDVGANNARGKAGKNSGKSVGTKKINRGAFSKRAVAQHKSSKPKKRKVRFGKKDNSKCSRW